MFDNVGPRQDPEWRRRQAISLTLTSALLGVVGFTVGVVAVEQSAALVLDNDGPMVMLQLEEVPAPGLADLPPAPAPQSSLASAKGEASTADAPAAAVVPSETPPPLRPIDERMRDVAGTADGSELGHGVRDGDGAPGSGGYGTADGGGGVGPVTSTLEAEVRFLQPPEYPEAARHMGLGEQVCRARVSLSDKGRPESVLVSGCPEVFHPAVRAAMLRSRWFPVRVGRERIRAATTVAVRFVLR